ncbi:MAG: hypothetical protein K6E49_02170 [Lachnospiraceae bacterium]|nr:hypothetical protein [Lachnospiraceae bacterium]
MKKEYNSLKYNYIDPSGNITILVESEIATTSQSAVSRKLMEYEPSCEQVGFIRKGKDRIRLRMAGGEFCGNAVMSAAALLCDDTGMKTGDKQRVTVDFSGTDDPAMVDITRNQDNEDRHYYTATLDMPIPRRIINKTLSWKGVDYDLPAVEFEGISHMICLPGVMDLPDEEIEAALRSWINSFNTECIGIMLIRSEDPMNAEQKEGTDISVVMRPLVYVPAVDTCVWESACASGTAAAAAYYSHRKGSKPVSLTAKEPGGVLGVSVSDGHLYLEGNVII